MSGSITAKRHFGQLISVFIMLLISVLFDTLAAGAATGAGSDARNNNESGFTVIMVGDILLHDG